MINNELHKQPTALDSVIHRGWKLNAMERANDRFAKFTSYMITLGEFGAASRDYPIVFVVADKDTDGKEQVAPIALFGMHRLENLVIENGEWTTDYVPSILRCYPFTLTQVKDSDQYVLVFDASWEGLSASAAGDPLFDDKGEPTKLLTSIHQFAVEIEADVERTRRAGLRLLELKLLKPMRFDATMPNGDKVSVDGFLTLDDERFAALTDAEVGELHRSGLLGLLHFHRLSLNNMTRLLNRRVKATGSAIKPAVLPESAANA